ncbi:hypothetical protein [Tsuneonella mangrovi]|uniref:hypothetical protein n=1 Tax=Tsuneonella mangrovi TaxID=1982042 RepID=UPI000BA23658|nr:hypothetical protein [Tsuneonella mangrovi]
MFNRANYGTQGKKHGESKSGMRPTVAMNALFAFAAPLALLVPTMVGDGAQVPSAQLAATEQAIQASAESWLPMKPVEATPVARQVRIEQRVIIRISPRGSAVRPSSFADMDVPMPPPPPPPPQLVERPMGKCVSVAGIAAAQPRGPDELLLFMRDNRLVAAHLDKSCDARDFYAGFYLERTGDGQMCVGRDRIHSRAGSNCTISRMRRLVEDDGN